MLLAIQVSVRLSMVVNVVNALPVVDTTSSPLRMPLNDHSLQSTTMGLTSGN